MKKIYLIILLLLSFPIGRAFAQDTLTLQESIDLALENNYEVKNADLEVSAAHQFKKAGFTRYFTNVAAGGIKLKAEKPLMEFGSHGSSMGFLEKGTIGYLNAVQPIFTGGEIINKNKLAGVSEDASKYKRSITKDDIVIQTEEQYWQIVSLEEKQKTLAAYKQMLSSLFKQVEDAYNAGVVMKNDVLKVQLKRSEVLLNESKLKNATQLAKMAFCRQLGLPLNTEIVLQDTLVINGTPQSLYVDNAQVLEDRDEYKLLALSVRAEKLQTRLTWSEYLPQVAVGASYQYLKFDDADGRSIGVVYGTVSIPISEWWGGSHELKKRKQEEKIAQNNFSDSSRRLLLQMKKAWQDLTDAYTQYQLSEESRQQAEENMRVNQDSYDNGLITVSDLLDARALLQQTQDQLTDAKSNYLVRQSGYLQVTGRLSEEVPSLADSE